MIKQQFEIEQNYLSKYAVQSRKTKGRARFEEPCPLRTEFQRDRDRIIHCKAFRRLKHKTQVFVAPEGDHFRTRLTHTLEVSQIARTIARALKLNEDLTEAVSLGHDLGHPPFGHAGERTLNRLAPPFEHNVQSLRVVDVLEKSGAGLNLTAEVRDGILNHRMRDTPMSLEAKVVSFADRIAYINHDIDDAIRAGILQESDLPEDITALLGHKKGERINHLILDLVENSFEKGKIVQSREYAEAMEALRSFMFERVYFTPAALEEEKKSDRVMTRLFENCLKNPETMPEMFLGLTDAYGVERVAADYIASMTDRYALRLFEAIDG